MRVQLLHVCAVRGVERIGRVLARHDAHAAPRQREDPHGVDGAQKRLDLAQHLLIAVREDDTAAVEIEQVDRHALQVQRQTAQQLEARKRAGFGKQGVGIVFKLRINLRLRRQQRAVVHGDHVEPQQILAGRGFLIRGKVNAADRRLSGGEAAQNAVPVAALCRVNVGDGAHQPDLCRRACLPDGLSDACGKSCHGFAVHVQPDLPVGVYLARLQEPAHEFLTRQSRLSGPAGIFQHMRPAETAAPVQRGVVMQAEIVLHPQNMR